MNVNDMSLSRARWRTSSYTNAGGACVEVADNLADTDGIVLVRDSKNRTGPSLCFTRPEWAAFVADARAGAFDLA
ncbi:MAG TPA: DUF397 domain-containing protein [Mycobacteriales bacterium]|nr:DUF397 domain-containing protein [Mycobacteriales bacterium]